MVAYPAGGDVDVLARMFAEKLAPRLKQSVVVENRTGAAGTIGSAYVSRANPDGYTLLLAPNTVAIAPLVLKPGTAPATTCSATSRRSRKSARNRCSWS